EFLFSFFFFQAEDGIRDRNVTGVQTCALPISAEAMSESVGFSDGLYSEIYKDYQEILYRNSSLDFDDLIMLTIELFKKEPHVLDRYQNRFQYIYVDEYQDTNQAQYELVNLLSRKYRNICVVGDSDQS